MLCKYSVVLRCKQASQRFKELNGASVGRDKAVTSRGCLRCRMNVVILSARQTEQFVPRVMEVIYKSLCQFARHLQTEAVRGQCSSALLMKAVELGIVW